MNLKKLFELQRQLDERIEQEHPRHPGEDRLEKKILALAVEVGELANETRCFKFWSVKPPSEQAVILEEYADVLRFGLSIGLDILDEMYLDFFPFHWDNITRQFIEIFARIGELGFVIKTGGKRWIKYEYEQLMRLIFGLAPLLGFTWEQVMDAYLRKNAINYERQDSGVY